MITVVTKPFEFKGEELASGTIVDSTAFRNESKLINCRFLREATESEVAQFKATPAGPPKKAKAKRAKKKAAPKAKAVPKKAAAPVKKKRTPRPATPAPAETDHDLSI